MSSNLAQIFIANPITTIGNTDLLYVDVSGTTDGAITGANLKAQFSSPLSAGTGTGSVIGGDGTSVASGNYALSYGVNTTTASGDNSFAWGDGSTASQPFSFAFGSTANAAASYSFAFGFHAHASGGLSMAIGTLAIAGTGGSVCWNDGNGGGATAPAASNEFAINFRGGYSFYLSSISVRTAGNGLAIAEGSDCKQGTATLTAGTVTVINASITTNSRVFLTAQDNSSIGSLRVSARTDGVSFDITSSVAGDSGLVAYEIFEPA